MKVFSKPTEQRQAEQDLQAEVARLFRHGNERQQQVALKLKKAGYKVKHICRCLPKTSAYKQ
tara:strand:+ start:1083 stop:1268 length:186 start_codon:yes stop_codon:yes gene_type:complete